MAAPLNLSKDPNLGSFLAGAKMPALRKEQPSRIADRDVKTDIKSAMEFAGPTRKDMVMNTIFTYPLFYLLTKMVTSGGGLPRMLMGKYAPSMEGGTPELPAAALTGLTALTTALQVAPNKKGQSWNQRYWVPGYLGMNKENSLKQQKLFDAALDMPITPELWARPSIGVRSLKKTIWESPKLNTGQRSFLNNGLNYATGSKKSGLTSFGDLGMGNSQAILELPPAAQFAVDVGKGAARLAEGAYLAKAFAPMLGFSPEATTWIARANAVTNALMGSQLFRSIK